MSLLFIDGFDSTSTGATPHFTKYAVTGAPTLSATARTGNAALAFSGAGTKYLDTKPLPASGSAIIGIAFQHAGAPSSIAQRLIGVLEGSTEHLGVALSPTGLLTVSRGGTVIATGTTILAAGAWYYLELKCTIHDTTGSYELRIDGVMELAASGIDTRNAGTTGQWDRVRLAQMVSGGPQTLLDDFYVCDGSGTRLNDFLGSCKVETLLPQTGNGTNVGLTPSTGTDHGALVDENPANTTDYNGSATVGAKDTYNYPSLTLTGTILGLQTNLYAAKSDTGARSVCAVVRAGGVDYDGATAAPTTTFGYLSEVRPVNPNTGVAWTPADIAALEAGMKVTA